jgi:membrane-bound lytic murein transglycosylase A
MRHALVWLLLPLLVLTFAACKSRAKKDGKDYNKALAPGEAALQEIDSSKLPDVTLTPTARTDISRGIANSLAYLAHASSDRYFPVADISKEQVVKSLHALDELVRSASSDAEFNNALRSRFRAWMSVGCDGMGTVLFTGYFTPVWSATLTPDATHRFPIYKKPADLVMPAGGGDPALGPAQQRLPDGAMMPYPRRAEIDRGLLRGQELAWVGDAFEAYSIQVQGSAKLKLPSGEVMEVGYDGTNNYEYHGIGHDLIADGKIPPDQLNYFTLREYFRAHPDEVQHYIDRNPRYVFFRRVQGGPFGSLGQPVIADVSIATDKSIFPRGAPTMVSTRVADPRNQNVAYTAIRLDQDTGGGIRAPGHADLYMGEGADNERRAGSQYQEGKLYYLILRD